MLGHALRGQDAHHVALLVQLTRLCLRAGAGFHQDGQACWQTGAALAANVFKASTATHVPGKPLPAKAAEGCNPGASLAHARAWVMRLQG